VDTLSTQLPELIRLLFQLKHQALMLSFGAVVAQVAADVEAQLAVFAQVAAAAAAAAMSLSFSEQLI
jgi:alpha/beta superfamily hydrolase